MGVAEQVSPAAWLKAEKNKELGEATFMTLYIKASLLMKPSLMEAVAEQYVALCENISS